MTVLRMDNIGIVVDDLDAAVAFFEEIGLELEGKGTVEGPWVDGTIGLFGARCDIAMLRMPDGHGRVELSKFQSPPVASTAPTNLPVNTLGYLRVMFAVDDVRDLVARLQQRHGATLVGEIVNYEDVYLLCYVRTPEGFMVGLAQPLDSP
jgi:catechol 2,3-dioxygenase-like lactoylglutathione lyase family enzyme